MQCLWHLNLRISVSGDLSAGKRNRAEISLEKRVFLKWTKKNCGHCHLLRKNEHYKQAYQGSFFRLGVLETLVLVSRPVFTSLGLGLGTLQSRSRSWDLRQWRLGLHNSWSVKLRQDRNHRLNYNANTVIYRSIWTLYKVLHPLVEKVFCPPATSAPVERIFSHSGLLMRANRARIGDNMLSQLVYLRYNSKLWVFLVLHSCD